ncbi:MAG: FtsQ-type POTRA domain-containing protein [Planctomycetota bacterium]|nr:FtsQ-type POTRA domain-containing protein [Planctomycetota bacterium]MDI6788652.1 FtsQ-type POTRA domain-containing protein [Planctomycetota bacterium]
MRFGDFILSSLKRWGIFIFIFTISVFMLLIIHRKVYAYYSTQPTYQIDFSSLEVLAKPDWCSEGYFEQTIEDSMKFDGQTPLFDRNLINDLLRKYEQNPWVARVESIEKQFPNKLVIKLEVRRPVAMVEMKKLSGRSFYYLIDKQTVRLPGEYYHAPSLPMTLPVIVGVRNSPPLPGEKWQDKGLSDAIDVAVVLKEQQVLSQLDITAIDISNINGRLNKRASEIVLLTKNHTQIEWGRPIKTDKSFELSPAEKIKNLYRALQVSPQLQGIKTVKIQFDRPYMVLREDSKKPPVQSPPKRSK